MSDALPPQEDLAVASEKHVSGNYASADIPYSSSDVLPPQEDMTVASATCVSGDRTNAAANYSLTVALPTHEDMEDLASGAGVSGAVVNNSSSDISTAAAPPQSSGNRKLPLSLRQPTVKREDFYYPLNKKGLTSGVRKDYVYWFEIKERSTLKLQLDIMLIAMQEAIVKEIIQQQHHHYHQKQQQQQQQQQQQEQQQQYQNQEQLE
ncbi:TPR-containing protein DDB_G0280363-like [Schistocerca nitens]|uniref:TPR-containing protein DDB_G0280363-like n=1 Tax=Schistocerca nitens TaxID=7011 RepID=UPI002117FB65|nr:TPR-containing protein DDB_G0280363-like [Schistocerca nitens]